MRELVELRAKAIKEIIRQSEKLNLTKEEKKHQIKIIISDVCKKHGLKINPVKRILAI